MTVEMSLPVALGKGLEPWSQADWNAEYHCQDSYFLLKV